MKSKPKGPKFRNLTARAGVIYYQRRVAGRRIRFSCETNDWETAAAVARLYEERRGIGRLPFLTAEAPTVDEFVARYLAEDVRHLAQTTQHDRKGHLRENGPLLRFFGALKIDEITSPLLREWWGTEIEGRGLSTKTGRAYLDTLSSVLGYAVDLGLLEASPVGAFREMLRRWSRTKQGRAHAAPGRHVRPIDSPDELGRLLEAAREAGPRAHLLVLLMLDAGLRLGEAIAVTWGQVVWGTDGGDVDRALVVDRNRPRGGEAEATKSGRERRVPLSRRLRHALAELHLGQGRPAPEEPILGRIDPNNFRRRTWAEICTKAKIGARRPKDLRDTFGSWLVSLGAPLPFVQEALGHSDWTTTARHYARWIPAAGNRPPPPLGSGEVWPDLLARLESDSATAPDRAVRARRSLHP